MPLWYDRSRKNIFQFYNLTCCPHSPTFTFSCLIGTLKIIQIVFRGDGKKFDYFVTASYQMMAEISREVSQPAWIGDMTKAPQLMVVAVFPSIFEKAPPMFLSRSILCRSRKVLRSLTPSASFSKVVYPRRTNWKMRWSEVWLLNTATQYCFGNNDVFFRWQRYFILWYRNSNNPVWNRLQWPIQSSKFHRFLIESRTFKFTILLLDTS